MVFLLWFMQAWPFHLANISASSCIWYTCYRFSMATFISTEQLISNIIENLLVWASVLTVFPEQYNTEQGQYGHSICSCLVWHCLMHCLEGQQIHGNCRWAYFPISCQSKKGVRVKTMTLFWVSRLKAWIISTVKNFQLCESARPEYISLFKVYWKCYLVFKTSQICPPFH